MKLNVFKKYLILPFIILTSCSTQNQLIEIERNASLTEPISIDGTTLQEKINNKNNFLLYLANPGCLSCAAFNDIINKYIENSSTTIYKIFTFQLLSSSNIEVTTVPEIIAFSQGKIKDRIRDLNTYSQFEDFLKKNVILPAKISINEETLDKKIEKKDTFIVKFSWNQCSDCNSSNELFLNKYHSENQSYTYYEFELSEYYEKRQDSNDPYWLNMTTKYGLSQKGNETLGWHNGVVPTYQFYEKGILKDAVVIYNDDYEKILDDYVTISQIKITNTYFSDSPYLGISFLSTENKNALQIYREETSSFYLNKISNLFKNIY